MGKIRKWNNILHRDIGYLCVGLTIVFGISGIAVNHIDVWNPNYIITNRSISVQFSDPANESVVINDIRQQLKIEREVLGVFRPGSDLIKVFFKNQTAEVNIQTGQGELETIEERFLLRDFNFLHLNHPKKIWSYVSDLYALSLLFLAVSGLFVLKGRKGIAGRGKWLAGAGFLIPVVFLVLYKYI